MVGLGLGVGRGLYNASTGMSRGLLTTTYYSLLRHQDVKRPTNCLLPLTRYYLLLRHQYVKQHRQRLEQRHHQDAQPLDALDGAQRPQHSEDSQREEGACIRDRVRGRAAAPGRLVA